MENEPCDEATPHEHPLVSQEEPDRPKLTVVPNPGAGADRRSEVARWVVTLSEPLVSTEQRAAADEAMGRFIDRNSDWACAYFAGLLTDLTSTLPPDDPWRHLAGLIDLDQIATGQSLDDASKRLAWSNDPIHFPATTGAVTASGRTFGTSQDSADLITVDVPDPTTFTKIAAVNANLSPLAAAILAFSSADAATVQSVLLKVYHSLWQANEMAGITTDSAGTSLLKTAGQALRWITHRRRVYTFDDDGFANMLGFAWIGKADRAHANNSISKEARQKLVEEGQIDPRLYREMRTDQ